MKYLEKVNDIIALVLQYMDIICTNVKIEEAILKKIEQA